MHKCIALLLISITVLALVPVSGCASPSSSKNACNQNVTSTAATVNQTLKTMVEKTHDMLAENSTMKAWNVTWIDANTVRVDYAREYYNTSENFTLHVNGNITIKRFNTVNDATDYLKSQVSGYKLDSTTPANDSAYIRATGHKPSTYERWMKINEYSNDHYDISAISQSDNFILSGNDVADLYAGRIT